MDSCLQCRRLKNIWCEEAGGALCADCQCGIFSNMLHSCSVAKQFLSRKKYRYHKSFTNNKHKLGEMFKDVIIKTTFSFSLLIVLFGDHLTAQLFT